MPLEQLIRCWSEVPGHPVVWGVFQMTSDATRFFNLNRLANLKSPAPWVPPAKRKLKA